MSLLMQVNEEQKRTNWKT